MAPTSGPNSAHASTPGAPRPCRATGSAAEVLEAVQDEVRYFSASLGESSHRPKPAARTYAERLGDCKDKVALLNAVLQRLGFDAQPALVSLQRNRGIADYLPGHDQFDHVITRLQLDDKVYWLDPTLQKQGRRLDTRGHPNYGMVLVVAPQTQALARVELPAGAPEGMEFDQTWDLSDLTRAAQFTSIVRVRGMAAEVVAQRHRRRRQRAHRRKHGWRLGAHDAGAQGHGCAGGAR